MFWAIYIPATSGILYLCFTAYPVAFSAILHWKVYNMHKIDPETGKPPTEARIAGIYVAAVLTPAAALWFAWTCYPTITNYDIYSTSALTGNIVSRSIIGAIMPLFDPQM
ncbi:hypothetical protein RUND412_010579 [Rhizina undulata]